MNKINTEKLFFILIGCVGILFVTNLGLFLRMNQLQIEVIQALQPLQRPRGLEVGIVAPSFSLPDTEGHLVSLKDYFGKPVLIMFSSTTCPGCKEMYPVLKDFGERNAGINILMISKSSEDENPPLFQEEDFTFPVLLWENKVASEYQVPGTPWFYMIDIQGMVANQGTAGSLEELEALVKAGE